jgi:hypothetical protein
VKNLLKFTSIGLVLALALFSQATFLTSPQVEAADVSENDIDFMTQTAAATVETHYKASSVNNTVAIYVRDKDLNKTITGNTYWSHCAGRVAALAMTGGQVSARTAGTYIIDHGDYVVKNAGAVVQTDSKDLMLTAVVNGSGAVSVAADATGFLNPGCGFTATDTITIADAALGGGGAADMVMTISTLDVQLVDATGKDIDGTTTFSLDSDVRVLTEIKKTADAGAIPDLYAYSKVEDSDGNTGRADTAAEKLATPHQYKGAQTSLVLNTLSVKQGATSLTTRAVNENAGTFKLGSADSVDVDDAIANDVVATYTFNAQQTYSASDTGSKRVHITSTSDATGEWIEIAEVADEGADDAIVTYNAGDTSTITDRSKMGHIDSAVFRGVVSINTDASAGAANNSVVWVQDGDTLTASFYEAKNASDGTTGALIKSTTATIDATAPSISNVSPADGTLTSDTTPTLSFTIEDAGSGFDKNIADFDDNISVTVNGCEIPASNLQVTSHSTSSMTLQYAAAIDWSTTAKLNDNSTLLPDCPAGGARVHGGFNVSTTSGPTALTSSTVHGTLFSWYISATDEAGNNKTLGKNIYNEIMSDLDI